MDVRCVVARVGPEGTHMHLNLFPSGLLLRVLGAATGGDESERGQAGGARPSRQRARLRESRP